MLTRDQAARQSLAHGAAGVALLHVERARTGTGTWETAHAHLRHATDVPIDAGPHAGLYYGAPAISFLLHAAADGHPRYRTAATSLDKPVQHLTRQRLAKANSRITRGEAATFAEYDLFHGLVGIGTLLLHRMPSGELLADLLRYLVRLVEPRHDDGLELPGWWVAHDPDPLLPTPGGHANLGMAHGAAGILALLALATCHGREVPGQREAISYLTAWFDRWRQESTSGPWWPQWLTRTDLRAGRPTQSAPGRPSWCYGTVGITRALQLAAITTNDEPHRAAAEQAMAASLTDQHLNQITDHGLCHGLAGIYQTANRAAQDAQDAQDAQTTAISQRLPALADALTHQAATAINFNTHMTEKGGLLTGQTGLQLALETVKDPASPRSGWDTCLLIT